MRVVLAVLSAVVLASCGGTRGASAEQEVPAQAAVAPQTEPSRRLTGVIEPVRSARVVVPQLSGPANRLTLTGIVAHGAVVAAGDVIAQFDAVEQITQARESSARFEDLSHQVRQKESENRASAERRLATLEQAEADLAKAELEVSKAEVLSDVLQQQNILREQRARLYVESLKKSNADRDKAEAAALRILELQRDRQRVAFERAQENIDQLQLKAPLSGMVAHTTTYRSGSMVRPQEGDQVFRNRPLLSIFDPSEMLIRAEVGEPDGALLVPGLKATVYIDAYPELALPAHFESASPVASSALGSPIKTFTATFRLDQSDRRLMPDLSAAVVLEVR